MNTLEFIKANERSNGMEGRRGLRSIIIKIQVSGTSNFNQENRISGFVHSYKAQLPVCWIAP